MEASARTYTVTFTYQNSENPLGGLVIFRTLILTSECILLLTSITESIINNNDTLQMIFGISDSSDRDKATRL